MERVSISKLLQDAVADWFDGEEFENRKELERALDNFMDDIREEGKTVKKFVLKMSPDDLKDMGISVLDELNEECEGEDE